MEIAKPQNAEEERCLRTMKLRRSPARLVLRDFDTALLSVS